MERRDARGAAMIRFMWNITTRNGAGRFMTMFGCLKKFALRGFRRVCWITILRKRENFREAFAGFDFEKVAQFDGSDVERLLQNAGIIRHLGKIEATINNAARAIELRTEYGSSKFFWSFKPDNHTPSKTMRDIPAITPESIALSKDLKKRGWRFVGPNLLCLYASDGAGQ